MIWGKGFPNLGPSNGGACARRVAMLGVGTGGGVIPGNFKKIFDAKCRVWGQFGPENKLIEGQPNEYDVICQNASVLAFHLWPTIFAGAPLRLQNICRNGVPPRSRTTTPLQRSLLCCGAAAAGRAPASAAAVDRYLLSARRSAANQPQRWADDGTDGCPTGPYRPCSA